MEGRVKSGSEYMELRGELRGIARWDKVNELDCALWGKWRSITEVRGCPGKGGISTTMAHQMDTAVIEMMEDLQPKRAFRS